MSSDVRHVEANGLRFAYLEDGRGPLVLFLHGFPDTARGWDHARGQIARSGRRAVSPWLRGYAPTAIPSGDIDLETLGRDALALIEALGARSAVIVGHDWGAAAAYVAATLDPARVRKLIVIGVPHPAARYPSPVKLWMVRHLFAYKLPGAAQRFARDDFAALPALYRRWSPLWNPSAHEFSAVRAAFADPASLAAAFGYYRQMPLRPPPVLREPIAVPTVAFAGLDDPCVTPADFAAAQRMFQADYIVEEMRGGHFMHREHPDEFATRLLAHL